jgi:serine/threonine protein kinase
MVRGLTVKIDDTEPIAAGGASEADPRVLKADTVSVEANRSDTESNGSIGDSDHRSGQTVDRYRIVKLIAAGGTAQVYEAVHLFTRRSVALKIMRHSLAGRRDIAERFRQEAVVLSSIRHENVVAVENAGLTEDGRVFIAMDLLKGETLRDLLLQRGQLTIDDTLDLMEEVAAGVAAAHEAGVFHRDLKPENIFCVSHGKVKVLDLGTAKYAGEHTPTIQTAFGKVVGTAAYVAPERFNGAPGDARGDIYALGLIMYECLAGYHPMVPGGKWPSAAEIASRQITFQPASLENLPPSLWRIISKAIQKNPAQRYRSIAEFRRALQKTQVELKVPSTAGGHWWQKIRSSGLARSIVAGSIFGMAVAGLAEWIRQTHLQSQQPPVVATVNVASIERIAPGHADSSLLKHEPSSSAVNVAPTVSTQTPAVVATQQILPAVGPRAMKPTDNSGRRTAAQVHEATPRPRNPKEDLPASGL